MEAKQFPAAGGSFLPKTRERRPFPQMKSFRTLNSDYDPLLPRRPGEHGVQLSCILAEVDDEHLTFPCSFAVGKVATNTTAIIQNHDIPIVLEGMR